MGGINYYRNLLYAIQLMPDRHIEPVLFTGIKINPVLLRNFPTVETVQTPLLDQFDPKWVVRMIVRTTMSTDWFLEQKMKQNKISVVSHYSGYLGERTRMRILGWIPDFQHVHFPEYFSKKELSSRDRLFRNIITLSSCVLLSSQNAFEDYRAFSPEFSSKARILHFVSQPTYSAQDTALTDALDRKYKKYKKYFYLPNQFWRHKNHKVVFEAVKILKDHHYDVNILCSGSTEDYRNKTHIGALLEYVRVNNLGENIHILGMINRPDVFYLMRNCVSVLNPSLFEGWSTTVEEAKSMGKNTILSNIPVHREQNPPGCIYFNPLEPGELADILWKKYNESNGGPDYELEKSMGEKLKVRTIQFAESYQNIILETFT
jgi:glycosyltransferase involved in cell wall biosynthesis